MKLNYTEFQKLDTESLNVCELNLGEYVLMLGLIDKGSFSIERTVNLFRKKVIQAFYKESTSQRIYREFKDWYSESEFNKIQNADVILKKVNSICYHCNDLTFYETWLNKLKNEDAFELCIYSENDEWGFDVYFEVRNKMYCLFCYE